MDMADIATRSRWGGNHGHAKMRDMGEAGRDCKKKYLMRPRESDKLARDYPVEVPMFDPFKMLIFLDIKSGEIQKSMQDCL